MLNERCAERESLIYHLRVFDTESDKVVGYLDDISTMGARLLSENPIPAHTTSRYRLELPRFYEGKRTVEFEAETTWATGDCSSRDFCDCGIKFIDLDPLDRERISQLIGSYHI